MLKFQLAQDLIQLRQHLKRKGVIKDARLFKYYAKFNNESQFQAGTYDLTKAMTPDELIQSLKTGKVYREPVFTMTIPEGLTLKEIGLVVEKRTGIPAEEFNSYVNDENTIDKFIAKYPGVINRRN